MRRINKIDAIKNANLSLLNESLPPMITFTENEVFSMLYEAFEGNIPENVANTFQEGLKSKGRYLGPNKTPDGAYD
jgi:hypothetical protein